MNEFLFFLQLSTLFAFTWGALRFGPSALTALIALEAILANLFVMKQTLLFGLNATCSDAFAVGLAFALNLLQEKFGKKAAKEALWISIGGVGVFLAMSAVHCLYTPSPSDFTQGAFLLLLLPTFRMAAASFCTYFIVQQCDLFFFGKLKDFFQGKRLPLRMGVSLFASQILDTLLFTFLGLYGVADALFEIFLVSLFIKTVLIAATTLFLLPRFVRHAISV